MSQFLKDLETLDLTYPHITDIVVDMDGVVVDDVDMFSKLALILKIWIVI